ncbi:hypothetical protein I3843_14G084900 [Carya illinoinensis]|uniref:Uncharacterized protein n=1 Tax=Carya illinoinensis TaxID=32201 RepID=A0A8T1NI22_CARIL|nr:uncharacterized protein LOC122294994 isoform X2 [Carya illinoinensis]KAG6629421.1 hypothetical protein CIPAW_14G083300 [Carya illinoinensis]KAG7947255.1 hypothetical protein I3843_14G084900 [Carya illinoinensis]
MSRSKALEDITALKEETETLKNSLAPISTRTADLIKRISESLPKIGGAGAEKKGSYNDGTKGVNAARKEVETLIGDPTPLNPIVKMLGDTVKALKTLEDRLKEARDKK